MTDCCYVWVDCALTKSSDAANQGRNHGIDIGGVQMWALPQIVSRGSDRKNKQARPSTNE